MRIAGALTVSPADGILSDQYPPHRVRMTRPFFLARYETTQAQYRHVMRRRTLAQWESGGRRPDLPEQYPPGPQRPVEVVSWDEAAAFCRMLAQIAERDVRLPTEAEWEYACRAGTESAFAFGEVLDSSQANFDHGQPDEGTGSARGKSTNVGSYPANAWGLFDTHGNVSEWCADWYDETYYRFCAENGVVNDPRGPDSGTHHVARGGSYLHPAWQCRSAQREQLYRTSGWPGVGFRVALSIRPGESILCGEQVVSVAEDDAGAVQPPPDDRAVLHAAPRRRLDTGSGASIELVYVGPGHFTSDRSPRGADQSPGTGPRTVRLTRGFFIGTTGLTQGQFEV